MGGGITKLTGTRTYDRISLRLAVELELDFAVGYPTRGGDFWVPVGD